MSYFFLYLCTFVFVLFFFFFLCNGCQRQKKRDHHVVHTLPLQRIEYHARQIAADESTQMCRVVDPSQEKSGNKNHDGATDCMAPDHPASPAIAVMQQCAQQPADSSRST